MLPALTAIDTDILQGRFERALRARVGRGHQLTRFQLAEAIGVDVRTVDGWLNEFRLPSVTLYYRLVAFFGPGFENEMKAVVDGPDHGSRSMSLADLAEQEKFHTEAVEKLRAMMSPPCGKVTELKRKTA